MHRRFAFAAAAAFVLAAPATLVAQTCQGYASFSSGSVQLGAGLEFAEDVTAYGAGIGFGAVNGGFVRGEIARANDDETDVSATNFGVSGGWQLGMGATSALQLCPFAAFNYTDYEEDFSSNEIGLGVAVGTAITSSPALTVAPFGAVSWRRFTMDDVPLFGDIEESYGLLDLGVGFVANEWITIRPHVSLPFAEPDDFDVETSYGVRFVFSFGKPGA
jgi:hypothetical protein